MKKYLLTGGFAAMLLLGACGNEEPTEQVEAETEEATEEESTEESTEEVEEVSDKGSRTNPYQIGETAEITITDRNDEGEEMEGKANISIDNVMRGEEAFTQLNEEVAPAKHEQPEEDSMEWMLFDLNFELLEFVDDDTSYTFATRVNIFNEDGNGIQPTTASREHSADNTLFQGASSVVKQAYTAPKEDKFLIKFADAEEDVFFEVPANESSNS